MDEFQDSESIRIFLIPKTLGIQMLLEVYIYSCLAYFFTLVPINIITLGFAYIHFF